MLHHKSRSECEEVIHVWHWELPVSTWFLYREHTITGIYMILVPRAHDYRYLHDSCTASTRLPVSTWFLYREHTITGIYMILVPRAHDYRYLHDSCTESTRLRIGECPSIAPFLENNGPRPRKGPRSIVFKEWNDTRTFAYVKSTQQLQPLLRNM